MHDLDFGNVKVHLVVECIADCGKKVEEMLFILDQHKYLKNGNDNDIKTVTKTQITT